MKRRVGLASFVFLLSLLSDRNLSAQGLTTKIITVGENHVIDVDTNETLIVQNYSGQSFFFPLVAEGKTNQVFFSVFPEKYPMFIATPCRIIISAGAITYRKSKNTGIKTSLLRNSQTNEIVAPAGKTIYFLHWVSDPAQRLYLTDGKTQVPLYPNVKGLQLAGPVKIMASLRIPGEFGQRFQFNSDTDSDSFRTAIPIQIGQ